MASGKKSYVGIDIGGTKTEGILWRSGKVLRVLKIKTPKSKDRFLKSLLDLTFYLSAEESYQGLGIGIPGIVNYLTGQILVCHHLPFLNNFNLARFFQKKLGKKVLSENDTKCFLRAEMRFGFAGGKKNVVAVTLGTGLGGAVLVEDKIVHGAHYAAQLTGMILSKDRGKLLTFEDLVSSHGFKRLAVNDPLEYQRLAIAGDKKAIKIYNEIGKYLGIALANIAKIFDPELIVIGGGIANVGRLLLKPALEEVRRQKISSKYLPIIKVSKLQHSGALGAVSLFLANQ